MHRKMSGTNNKGEENKVGGKREGTGIKSYRKRNVTMI